MAFDVRRGEAFTIQISSNQVDIAGFLLKENGVVVAETPANPDGVQFRLEAGRPPGVYTYTVVAVGKEPMDGGVPEQAESDPITWTVGHAFPQKPTIVIVK